LREIFEVSIEKLAERAHSKNIELACLIETDVKGLLRGDPVRFRQILTNLVSNAVKFTEVGEVLVHVETVEETLERIVIRFEVKDTGIGIPADAVSRIFQEFTQVDGSTTRKYGGTGLGLTISKQLVTLMQGAIGMESTLGTGSTFWFELPFEKQPSIESGGAEPQENALANLRVLIVDGTASHRRILHQHLEQWSIVDDHASTATEALVMIQQAVQRGNPYPLLIIDLDMPGSDGLALAQTIKNDPQLAESRIIMLTTLLSRLNTTTMKATGISACLVKPIRHSRLRSCLVDTMSPSGAMLGPPHHTTEISKSSLSRTMARNVRLLLAEDNLVNQRVALKQLKKLGFCADAVSNGNEVLFALQRIPYDIIIMDCQMPEMDGYEVTRRIRQDGSDSYIHSKSAPYIIALTANAMRGDRERCLALGMNDYLTKPLHLHDLEDVLQRALLKIQPSLFTDTDPPVALDPVVDRSVINGLKELREPGQADPLQELIALFLKDADPRVLIMDEACRTNDMARLASASHTVKGSASNLGARRLALLCATLERQSREGDSAQAAKTLSEVKTEFAKVRAVLSSEFDS
jgi:two-component system sensor histidine kinase/response regulator